MPQNFYLHSSLVLTRKIKVEDEKLAQFYYKLECGIVIAISFIINLSVIGTFSHYYNQPSLELGEADKALSTTLGQGASIMWAIGLFSSGQSATVSGALTGQYVMEGFLNLKISRTKRLLMTRLIALLPCIIVLEVATIENANIFQNIIQFIQQPFVMIPTIKMVSNENIMHNYRLTGFPMKLLIGVSVALYAINIIQIIEQFPSSFNGKLIGVFFCMLYSSILVYLIKLPLNINFNSRDFSDEDIGLKSIPSFSSGPNET